ncbi:sigma 54-interacting transcriptional regulator [Microaerobacter geothermalis]|uniref:sigma-54-dependent Fis family transcriptional regulator n=1 Tax=Microaerobacter geothermalis TaxID=674972 RepID=UPI001F426878|nr:sigma-54-dependent Fis family transcriptional regulator [Microaerobacter geothermalis]MCF6095296.1 sigma 54-interacting transcriptional regulator [Microaerobacter geothermalis]
MSLIQLKDIMTPVKECLQPDHTLSHAIQFMMRTKWNTIPVTDQSGKLLGVFTRSILYQLILKQTPLHTPIREHMKKEAYCLPLDTPYEEIERVVKTSKVGTGIVVDQERKVIGLFTKTDMIFTLFRSTHSLKEQLETILHSSQLGACMTDEHDRITFANQKLCQWIGKKLEDLIGKKLYEMIPGFPVAQPDEEYKLNILHRVKVGNNQTISRLSKYQTVNGKDGWIAIFQNVTEIEKMAEELKTVKMWKSLLDTAIENAYDGIVMVNEKSEVVFLSPPIMELFSLDKEESLGKSIDELLPQLELTQVLKTGEANLSDFMEINGIKYIVTRIPVIQDGQMIGAIGKVTFRQLHQVKELFKKLEAMENKVTYYQEELKKSESARYSWEQISSANPQMEKLKRSAYKAAKGRSTILIRGESGTGKELFAHAIHSVSARKNGPFVTVNCAAIPEHLLESEFFGYEEGAFTGAKQKGKIGKFDLANGGTLFLDEIGDMSSQLQAKLLRVLQEKEFYRVGGTEKIHVDVRIIAATNRSLEEMVEKGDFREDLFYRLNVISFEIPPLRKRKEDILLLTEIFIEELNRIIGTSITGIESRALEVLMGYHWPGNVRELKNVLERGMTFAEHGKIQMEDLPDYLLKKVTDQVSYHEDSNRSMLEKAEESAIHQALQQVGGNKTKAAKLLGISRSMLYEKLKKYR